MKLDSRGRTCLGLVRWRAQGGQAEVWSKAESLSAPTMGGHYLVFDRGSLGKGSRGLEKRWGNSTPFHGQTSLWGSLLWEMDF